MNNSVSKIKQRISRNYRAITIIIAVITLHSCFEEKKDTIKSFKNINLVPTLKTTHVSTLISDSGITRYRLVTEEWAAYEGVIEPYWHFPKGIYVEKFDSIFRVEASIKADSAYFQESKKLWHLVKNVKILNLLGERFETDELYWDQYQQKIYSDKFVKITQANRIITGLGFESNESMTRYQIHKTQGIFEINDANSESTP